MNFIGGYTALVSKGMTPAEELLIRSIPQALAQYRACMQFCECWFHKDRNQYGCSEAYGRDYSGDSRSNQRDKIPLAVPSWLYSAMHRMTTRLWQVLSTVLQKQMSIINVGVSGPGVVKTALEKVRWSRILKLFVRRSRRLHLR